MKLKLLWILFFVITVQLQAQTVNIPDANFKAYLVGNSAINTNGDAQIQLSEASAFTGIMYPNNRSISDLTGIEAFTGLTGLYCDYNQLTSLDVSANTALTVLHCHHNQLEAIDISANTALREFDCNNNAITTLDVSTNVLLEKLYFHFNQITTINITANTALLEIGTNSNPLTNLDVSANTALTAINCNSNSLSSLDVSANTDLLYLYCSYNMLSSLDISTNASIVRMYCNNNSLTELNVANGNNATITGPNINMRNNSGLTCVNVDNVAYSNANWTNKDAGTTYGTNCGTLGTTLFEKETVRIYPNPASNIITIEINEVLQNVTLYNILGKQMLRSKAKTIDISHLSQGVYMLQIEIQDGILITKKIIKK